MNSQPIAFDKTSKDSLLYKIVRKSFRIPLKDPDIVWVNIEGSKYPIRDICLDGIGITLENPSAFTISQIIKDCELHIGDKTITGLNGRVVHFSLNSGKDWQCGIQWISIADESEKKMTDIVSQLKKEFLNDDHQTD